MPRYLNSTHQKHWILTQQDLDSKYSAKQSALLQKITNMNQNLQRYAVTKEEENIIILFLSKNLITACKHLSMHDKAICTALAYYKRFYINNSVIDYDPVQMMFTSMFLSCKTEEINIRDIKNFCQNFRESDPKAILQLEYCLISGIKFHLYVFSPKKSLKALLESLKDSVFNAEERKSVETKSEDFIEKCLISDIFFKYSPAEIALSSLYYCLKDRNDRDEVFKTIFESIGKLFEENRDKFLALIEEYLSFVEFMGRVEPQFRGLLKKASSLKHRLEKPQNPDR